MTSLVVFYSCQIKLRISTSKTFKKFYQKSYDVILTNLSVANKNCGENFRFINTLMFEYSDLLNLAVLRFT